jgi:hypothetical protein
MSLCVGGLTTTPDELDLGSGCPLTTTAAPTNGLGGSSSSSGGDGGGSSGIIIIVLVVLLVMGCTAFIFFVVMRRRKERSGGELRTAAHLNPMYEQPYETPVAAPRGGGVVYDVPSHPDRDSSSSSAPVVGVANRRQDKGAVHTNEAFDAGGYLDVEI